ncbi:MAG: long-chain fatty acid--CoA ligase [Flavobacteriales bacterium]|nr:long-chain fatty acid--CoA ligase [Flavobacteriales bacterium]
MDDVSTIKRIFDVPEYQKNKYDLDVALAHRVKGTWEKISSTQYIDNINKVARSLIGYGIKKGDKIGLISSNRMEWCILDQAIMKVGGITVPVYPTISHDDYKYIFNHSEIRLCFVGDKNIYSKVEKVKTETPYLEAIYSFDQDGKMPYLEDFIQKYDSLTLQKDVDSMAESIKEDDIATLLYTSGTTGTPKGVVLTHKNILSNALASAPRVLEIEHTTALSFLPLCHIYERTVNLCYQVLGCGVYFAKSTETISQDAQDAHPHIMMVVPRVMERVYAKIMAKGEALKGIKKLIFFWAVREGKRFEPYHNNWFYRIRLALARKLVFNKWKEALGGKLEIIISGSSCLDPRLSRLFCATGMILNEGYGLTETSPIVSTNVYPNGGLRIGSIGRPLENLDVKIADDGEILVKGPSVMNGYYKDPERTAEVIDKNGYFHTGDIGHITDGFLYITDRKKEMFKTSGGKYITPQPMENRLGQSRFIEQAMVVGNGKQHPGVIIEPDMTELKAWCMLKGIDTSDVKTMLENTQVQSLYKKEINEVNKNLGGWEKIKRFRLVPDTWTVEGGDITPTLKLKRRRLMERYANLIAQMYSDEDNNL